MEEPHSPQGGRQRGPQERTGAAPLCTCPHAPTRLTCTRAHTCAHPQPSHTRVHTGTHLDLHTHTCLHLYLCAAVHAYTSTRQSAHTPLHQWPPRPTLFLPNPKAPNTMRQRTREPPFLILQMTEPELKILTRLNLFRSISNNNTSKRLFYL